MKKLHQVGFSGRGYPLVCVTPHLFTRDPAAFYKERGRIAELIERYQKEDQR